MIREYKELRKFRIKRHTIGRVGSRQGEEVHTKRFETTLTTFDDMIGKYSCSRLAVKHTSASYDRHGPDYRAKISTEAPCNKCGWKILYTEPYTRTYNSQCGSKYYHERCHN